MTIPYEMIYTVEFSYSAPIAHLSDEQRKAIADELDHSQFKYDWCFRYGNLIIDGEHRESDAFNEREIEDFMDYLAVEDFGIELEGGVDTKECDSRDWYDA